MPDSVDAGQPASVPDSAAVSEAAYRTALTLIDEGARLLGVLYKDVGLSPYKATLSPTEHADLALRLARLLTSGEAVNAT